MNFKPTIEWYAGHIRLIDQTKLPIKLEYIHCRDVRSLWNAIKRLSVRGAPALGVAGAFGVLIGLKQFKGKTRDALNRHIEKTCCYLETSRPTAVNLFNALDEMRKVLLDYPLASVDEITQRLFKKAEDIYQSDRIICRQMGMHGQKLIRSNSHIMTICNAGALATVDYGTALGVMYAAKEHKKKFHVYACETRPLLQGSRLTAWELKRQKIPVTVICDNMAATVMKEGKISAIFTGADRIAANGDAANKIGTYSLAVLAKHHNIPFYVVAPKTTFDFSIPTGRHIPIEQRSGLEVTHIKGKQIAPNQINVFNPAFDVTEARLITGIVTERGVITKLNATQIRKTFNVKRTKSQKAK